MPASRGLDRQEILRRLIAFDTTSAKSNLALTDFVAGLLERPGVRIEQFYSPDGTKANLLVELGPEPTTRRACCSGTPTSFRARRLSDPFALTERMSVDGPRWFARGSADMKGFIALAVELASELEIASLEHPLALLFTYDEEVGTLGAQHFASAWARDRPLPRLAVIGEPTSLEVVRLHKGHLKLAVTVRGAPAHSSLPHLGKNAIEAGARAVAALGMLRDRLQEEHPEHGEHFPGAPFVTLNVARIAGGTAINIVPDRCLIELGIRLSRHELAGDHRARSRGSPMRFPTMSTRSRTSAIARLCFAAMTRRMRNSCAGGRPAWHPRRGASDAGLLQVLASSPCSSARVPSKLPTGRTSFAQEEFERAGRHLAPAGAPLLRTAA